MQARKNIYIVLLMLLGIGSLKAQYYGKEAEAVILFDAGRTKEAAKIYAELAKSYENKTKPNQVDLYQRYCKQLATCYKKLHNYKEALAWLKIYLEQRTDDLDAKIEYAELLKMDEQYEQAYGVYVSLAQEYKTNRTLKKRISGIKWAIEHLDSTRNAKVYKTELQLNDNLGFSIAQDSLFASFPLDNNPKKTPTYLIKRAHIQDSLRVGQPVLLPLGKNLINAGAPTFSADKQEIFYSTVDDKKYFFDGIAVMGNTDNKQVSNNLKIVYSKKMDNGKWSDPSVLPFCNPNNNYTHPFLTKDGKKLYFVSDENNKFKAYDIHVSKRNGDDWSQPRKLDTNVNSERTEMFPFLYKGYLFFSSYGRENFGGADVFRAKALENDKFERAENLGKPINSSKDDFGLFLTDSTKGYFVSNRDDENGKDDLYYLRVYGLGLTDDALAYKEVQMSDSLKAKKKERMLAISTYDKKSLEQVKDLDVQLYEKKNDGKDSVRIKDGISTNEKGETVFKIDKTKEYSLVIDDQGKADGKKYIPSVNNMNKDQVVVLVDDPRKPDLALKQQDIESKLAIKDTSKHQLLFFDFDKFDLLELEKIKLQKVVKELSQDVKSFVLLEGHADSRGYDWYNDNLSRRRVLSVVQFLESKGIYRNRVFFSFFGKRKLLSADNEDVNRRVEVKIVYRK